jgi:streptogramin lyase
MATMGGNLWFSGWASVDGAERGVIGRIEPGAAGALSLFPLEPGCGAGEAFTATADTIWFGESCPLTSSYSSTPPERASLGQMNSTGTIARLPLPAGEQPIAVAAGSDASVWVGMRNDYYRRPSSLVHVEAGGNLVERRVRYASFGGMAVGPEGRLWFASLDEGPYYDAIASIGPAGRKSRPICVSGKHYCEGEIGELTTGPEGILWYAAGPAASHGIGGGGGSGLIEEENLARAAGFIGRVNG